MVVPVWWRIVAGVAVLVIGGLAAFPAAASPPEPTPAPDTRVAPNATPGVDRLAAPPTVVNPNQADIGAQLFWLHCQPCHGDQGQGLTDEWRAQYPPEDQNCWKSGCHGDRPYQNGFTLPHTVPALLGLGTLGHFATAADLYAFMSHAMPFQAPGSLKPEEYWAITAFLLRGHGLPAASLPVTDAAVAARIPLGAPLAAAATAAPVTTPAQPNTQLNTLALAASAAAVLALVTLAGWLVRTRRRPPHG
jgi:cytochrome c